MSLVQEKNKELPAILSLKIGNDTITAALSDGREISIPIVWFERLATASKEQLLDFQVSPSGYGIHWPKIDEDISVKAFIYGL